MWSRKPFVVTRNKHVLSKERRIERLPCGYSIREFNNHPHGRYWERNSAAPVPDGIAFLIAEDERVRTLNHFAREDEVAFALLNF